MRNLPWKSILAWLLAAFFVVGGIGNIFVSPEIAADYRRWGYPDWFHFLTGALELSAAVLIAYRPTRLWGACLASGVMVAAAFTVLSHGEFAHAIAPLIVLAVALTVSFLAFREKASQHAGS
ncbi:DoxX family protein [Sinirhodobacter populi]|uniref:DoxX family protein n=1 Tax=Paenirhodobacter populi TaxID=2306993 RepID=A0A443K3H3_9RHOB|nr:DoxX family protein [Sinirhodobacter populi]RWR27319.1 DoxX family protein [Sinirhodobacter populi]